jgi:hypothetical protein
MKFKFSIKSIAGLIAIVALCFSALAYPSAFWATAVGAFTLLALLVGLLGVLFNRGQRRIAFAGFSLCGWTYLLLMSLPSLEEVAADRIPTWELFGQIGSRLHPPPEAAPPSDDEMNSPGGLAKYAEYAAKKAALEKKRIKFKLICEHIFSLLFGGLGAVAALAVAGNGRRQRSRGGWAGESGTSGGYPTRRP